jgi:two-component system sensor histidine kinase YesM
LNLVHDLYSLFRRPSTLRGKIIVFFTAIVAIMGVVRLYFYYNESVFLKSSNLLTENILYVIQLDQMVDSNSEILQKYKATGSRNYISQLNANKENMNIVILNVKEEVSSEDIQQLVKELKGLAYDYSTIINDIIFSKGREGDSLISEAEDLLGDISVLVKGIYEHQTEEIRFKYREFNEKKRENETVVGILLLLVTVACFASIILFTKRLLKPVSILTEAAKEISKGKFDIVEIDESHSSEEMKILTSAFNKMVKSIKQYIAQLEEKVEIERRLKAEELKNERTNLALKQAELLALQSQVNPHFMFNTLNVIAKIAYSEDAYQTASMIGSMSTMLRYSLGSLKKVVSLEQEFANLEKYIFIQQTRFGERLQFIKKVECDISEVMVPCLTVQPLVENAIMHGIEGKESGGYVMLHCYCDSSNVYIIVKDNGVGMSEEMLKLVLSKSKRINHKGHTTGLGINNVKERLELYYGGDGTFEVCSKENEGTEVKITLPLKVKERNGMVV